MADEKNVFFERVQVWKLEVALLAEFLELVEFVNQPSHDEDEALNFSDELICEVDFLHLLCKGVAIRLVVYLALSYDLELFGFLLEHLYDIHFILHPLIIFVWFYVFSVGFTELFTENLTNYCYWVISLLQNLTF